MNVSGCLGVCDAFVAMVAEWIPHISPRFWFLLRRYKCIRTLSCSKLAINSWRSSCCATSIGVSPHPLIGHTPGVAIVFLQWFRISNSVNITNNAVV